MSRAKNARADEALELYKQGLKLIEIAKQLGVPEGTVRRWKSTYQWDNERSEKNSERSEKKKTTKRPSKEAVDDEVIPAIQNAELSEKQRLFCLYFVKYRNKVKAYQKAYMCSYENACSHAWELWKNVEIQKEIQRLLDEFRTDIGVDIKDLFQWYLDIARADINDFVDIRDSSVRVRGDIDGTLVSEISETANGIKVKLNDRMKAMEWLDAHIGLADEKQRAEIAVLKARVDTGDEGECVDDGFIDALSGSAKEDWADEED